jgi:hypothetical protein
MVPGFTGGVEIPEILRPPAPHGQAAGKSADATGATDATKKAGTRDPAAGDKDVAPAPGGKDADAGGGTPAPARPARRLLGLLLRRPPAAPAGAPAPAKEQSKDQAKSRRTWSNPLLLFAAALLVAGVVLSHWYVLALGWVIAYASRRLTDAEIKWAVIGLPGLALGAGIVWLWGRQSSRWGEAIGKGQLGDALLQTGPWVVRGAALGSAAFLVWRSQRRRS